MNLKHQTLEFPYLDIRVTVFGILMLGPSPYCGSVQHDPNAHHNSGPATIALFKVAMMVKLFAYSWTLKCTG